MGDTKLTSVNHPKEQFGEKAGEMLIEMIKAGKMCSSYVFQGELVVRESVRPV